jgi:hypothetical protein
VEVVVVVVVVVEVVVDDFVLVAVVVAVAVGIVVVASSLNEIHQWRASQAFKQTRISIIQTFCKVIYKPRDGVCDPIFCMCSCFGSNLLSVFIRCQFHLHIFLLHK